MSRGVRDVYLHAVNIVDGMEELCVNYLRVNMKIILKLQNIILYFIILFLFTHKYTDNLLPFLSRKYKNILYIHTHM